MANGSDYCSHLLGLELTCNLSSERSTTMTTTPYESGSSDDTSYPPDRMPLKELFLSFNRLKPGTLLIPGGRGYEDEVWILFGSMVDCTLIGRTPVASHRIVSWAQGMAWPLE